MEGGDSGGGSPNNYGNGGGSAGGFHNIDNLNLGSLLRVKQMGRAKRKLNVHKLMEKGFK